MTIVKKIKKGVPAYQAPVLSGTPSNEEWIEGKQFYSTAMHKWPIECATLRHVTNEGKRTKWQGDRLRQQGLITGTSDYILMKSSGPFGSLAIELKRADGGNISQEQADFLIAVNNSGGYGCFAYGYKAALYVLEKYLLDPKSLL